jgi:scyllo-inositol 2-dehydrogenase (NADP+)
MDHSPNVVIVGYGFAGRDFHAYLVRQEPRLNLYGIVSRSPETRERIVRELGCRAIATYDEALADPAVDLIVVASPNAAHAEQSIQALHAGKHVVTDKVMALRLSDCDAMIAAAQESGKLLSVFQNRRLDGDFRTVRQVIQSGRLGAVRWIEVAWQGLGAWGGWRGSAAMGGGRFYDLGAHLIDQLCQLFPEPIETVYARITRDFAGTDVDSEALIVVTFAGGKTGIADLSSRTAVSRPRFLVHGELATFEKHGLDPQEKAMIAQAIDTAVEDPARYGRITDGRVEEIVPTVPGRWRDYYENIADVLVHGAEPLVCAASVRRQIAVMDAALRSAETGTTVRLEE